MKWRAVLRTGLTRHDYAYRRFVFTAVGFGVAAETAERLRNKHGGVIIELRLVTE